MPNWFSLRTVSYTHLQTGAKGSISGAELVDKENAAAYNGAWMAGSYIRPFTVEFAAKITF